MTEMKTSKILVTGGAGFIGHHLVDRLINDGNDVVVIDNLSTGRKENLNPKVRFYRVDVRGSEIPRILEEEEIRVIFHLAAQAIVDTAYKNPLETIETNVMGTTNILEACRLKESVESLIVASSDKAYGKARDLPCAENTPLKGDHPYEVSKSAADLIAQSYSRTYNLPIIVTRFGNTFGPADINFNRIIPGIFKAVIKNEELLIRSDGKMIREYIYVEDVVNGYVELSRNIERAKGEAFNFGSKDILSVVGVIERIEKILNTKVNYKILNIAKNEIPKQYLDWTKAREILNWQPEISFEKGIKESFDWYKDFLS